MSGAIRRVIGPAKARLVGYMDEVKQMLDAHADAEGRNAADTRKLKNLQLRIGKTVELLENENDKWSKLMERAEGEARQTAVDEYDAVTREEGNFIEVMDRGRECLDVVEIALTPTTPTPPAYSPAPPTPTDDSSVARFAPGGQAITNVQANLPKMSLPVFAGDPLAWPTFWQTFEALVDSQRMATIQKLSYLLSCLKGDALREVSGYQLTAENYGVVVDVLRQRYDNKQLHVQFLNRELVNLSPAGESTESVRAVFKSIERICRQLVALGEEDDSQGLSATIRMKLPRGFMMELVKAERAANKGTGQRWTTTELRDQIREMLEVRDEVERNYSTGRPKEYNQYEGEWKKDRYDKRVEKARMFAAVDGKSTQSKGGQGSRRPACVFCDKSGHWSGQCRDYATPEKRFQRLKELRKCLRCYETGHMANECPKKGKCTCGSEKHGAFICLKKSNVTGDSKEKKGEGGQAVRKSTAAPIVMSLAEKKEALERDYQTLLMAKNVEVASEFNERRARSLLLFDTGSEHSWITHKLARRLRLPRLTKPQLMGVTGFQGMKGPDFRSPKFLIKLKREHGEEVVVNSAPSITEAIRSSASVGGPDVESQLKRILDSEESEPEILLGIGEFWEFIRSVQKVRDGLFEVCTSLGTMLCGRSQVSEIDKYHQVKVMSAVETGEEEESTPSKEQVESFWALESIGVHDSPDDNPNEIAMERFKEALEDGGDHYTVGWPWKEKTPKIESNRGYCVTRLRAQWKQGQREPERLKVCDEAIRDWWKTRKFVEEAPAKPDGPVRYLAHHLVRGKKPRVVHEANGAVGGGPSLNDLLYRGPIRIPDLAGMLMRFRTAKIVVMADVEKAFLQLRLKAEDRDVTRFLWLRDVTKPPTEENIVELRFARVPFGVVSSPFLLQEAIEHHLAKYDEVVAREISANVYVDNVMMTAKTVEEAAEKIARSKAIFRDCSMNLREYVSNEEAVNAKIPPEDRLDKPQPKVLGIPWKRSEDVLEIDFASEPSEGKGSGKPVSRRTVSKVMGATFDPLGLVAPAILPLKLFFQSLWGSDHEWDKRLSTEEAKRWGELVEQLKMRGVRVPRLVLEGGKKLQLHAFVDASELAYAAAVYVREGETTKDGSVHLVFSKNKLRPKAAVSIPRMEMLAMLVGTRCLTFVEKQLRRPVEGRFLWGDSQCVLKWVAKCDDETRFVQGRMKEIRGAGCRFRYVNTHQNPADVASRGCCPDELKTHPLWWQGPKWLSEAESNWPQELEVEPPKEKVAEENTDGSSKRALVMSAREASQREEVFDYKAFENYDQLLHSTMEELKKSGLLTESKNFTAEDYKAAERVLVLRHQAEEPVLEKYVSGGGRRMMIDEQGIVRVPTRLERSGLPQGMTKPILLNHYSQLTGMIIRHVHEKLKHSGVDATLTEFLTEYFTPRARTTVRRALDGCKGCWKMTAKPYEYPDAAQLPKERVTESRAFAHIGVDFLGPTAVVLNDGSQHKVWVLLATCMATRAVYLESCLDLSAATFVNCLRRFIARRGKPETILSDNGTTFRLAAKVIEVGWQELLDEEEVAEFVAQQKMEWRFIPALSPWRGGFYERLVALVKTAFKKTVGSETLEEDEFATFVAEVEATLNSRPLTYVSDEADGFLPLRPIDFLHPRAIVATQYFDEDKGGDGRDGRTRVVAMWRSSLKYLKVFWNAWRREYMLALRERTQWRLKQSKAKAKSSPQVGAIVLIGDETAPRNLWRLGKIIELQGHPVRSAVVELENKRHLQRSINHLYPCEIPERQPGEEAQRVEKAHAEGKDEAHKPMPPESTRESAHEGELVANGVASKPKGKRLRWEERMFSESKRKVPLRGCRVSDTDRTKRSVMMVGLGRPRPVRRGHQGVLDPDLRFDGEVAAEWGPFCRLFLMQVDSRPHLSDAQKATYLRNCLEGEAFEVVRDVNWNDYASTWHRLIDRYQPPPDPTRAREIDVEAIAAAATTRAEGAGPSGTRRRGLPLECINMARRHLKLPLLMSGVPTSQAEDPAKTRQRMWRIAQCVAIAGKRVEEQLLAREPENRELDFLRPEHRLNPVYRIMLIEARVIRPMETSLEISPRSK